MAKIKLYNTQMMYEKAGGDEWDEVFEQFIYYYDDRKNEIIEVREYGRDNARDPSTNYKKTETRVIQENELPKEVKIKLRKLIKTKNSSQKRQK